MKLVVAVFAMMLNGFTVLLANEPQLVMNVKGIPAIYSVGDAPLVQVELKNLTKHTIYIDYNEFNISSSIYYEVGINKVPRIIASSGITPRSDGIISNEYLGKNTIGIKPGQSLIRVIKIDEFVKPGKARIHVLLYVFMNKNLSKSNNEWNGIPLSASFPINILPRQ